MEVDAVTKGLGKGKGKYGKGSGKGKGPGNSSSSSTWVSWSSPWRWSSEDEGSMQSEEPAGEAVQCWTCAGWGHTSRHCPSKWSGKSKGKGKGMFGYGNDDRQLLALDTQVKEKQTPKELITVHDFGGLGMVQEVKPQGNKGLLKVGGNENLQSKTSKELLTVHTFGDLKMEGNENLQPMLKMEGNENLQSIAKMRGNENPQEIMKSRATRSRR